MSTILDQMNQFIDNDVAMIFGETGAGKSKLVTQVALDAAKAGKKVKFIDTERNLSKSDISAVNKVGKYIYNPTWKGLENEIKNLGKFDLLIIDSIGMPALVHYAGMSLNAKGGAMLDMIGALGKIKAWCYDNNAVALVTNQNQSALAAKDKDSNYILRPFGEKAQYVCKEIWRMVLISSKPKETFSTLSAYRSREMGRSTVIADVNITDNGVALRMKLKSAPAGISKESFAKLMNDIEESQALFELEEIAGTIKSLTNEMAGAQKQALRTAYSKKEKEMKDQLGPDEPEETDEHLNADKELAKQESIIQ